MTRECSIASHLRIFIGCFSEEIGGQVAADRWANMVEHIVQMRTLNPPLPIVGGVLAAESLDRYIRSAARMEACCTDSTQTLLP